VLWRLLQRDGYVLAGDTEAKTQAALLAAFDEAAAMAPCILYIANFGMLRDVSDAGAAPKGRSGAFGRPVCGLRLNAGVAYECTVVVFWPPRRVTA